MHFDDAIMSDPSAEYEIEYITDDADEIEAEDKTVLITSINTEKSPIKKKTPIIRKAGEIVTPLNVRRAGSVKGLSPTKVLTVRRTEELKKVGPPLSNVSLTTTSRAANDGKSAVHQNFHKSEIHEHETFDHEYAEAIVRPESKPHTQMDRIEKKLDIILEKLNQHDAAFKAIKYSMQELRVDFKNSGNGLKELSGGPLEASNVPPSKRKRHVSFPVTDDSYLLRLEDLLLADDKIRDEVTMLFKDAPRTSVYEFLRRNIYALFENCSKYTWTGKPSNAMPSMPPANVASKMALVDHLITCACEIFPNLTRETIAKDFRRALANFNDTVYTKRRKRSEMKLQNVGVSNDCDSNAE